MARFKPSRSPAPLRTPTTPSQFFPPAYFAAAAGVPYPPTQQDQDYPFSSNASYLVTECSPHAGRTRRKSQLGDLESQLLPTLSDTVERMTRPPSQVVPSAPFRPVPRPEYSPGIARTSSISSQSSSAYSVRSEACSQTPTTSGKHTALRSPSNAYPEQPARPSSSRSPNPKSILKSHTISDRHLQVRQAHWEDRLPTDHARKAGRSPIPIPPEPESRIEHARQLPTSPKPKIDGSLRTGRARSRTDPGTLPKGLPSTHARNALQPNPLPSGIPRRVGIPPSPATPRISTTAQASIGSDAGSGNSTQPEKRRLFVTNAEISSSSSSETHAPLMRYVKPKPLSRTDSQSSTESQLRPPRFGLGLGLSGVNESKNSVKYSPGQRWTTKISGDESYLRHTNSPGNKRHGTPKRRDRSPSRNPRVDSADGRRRQRELLALMHADLNDSSGCDSQPSSSEGSEDQCLVSDGSGDSLRSAFDDSGSEYSPAAEDAHALPRTSTRWETKLEQSRSRGSARQSRNNFPESDSR